MIYFIRNGDSGGIKIGVSDDPKTRLSSLQVGAENELELLCVINGDSNKEKELHQQFKTEQIRGEWFNPSERLLAFIKENKKSKAINNIKNKTIPIKKNKKHPKTPPIINVKLKHIPQKRLYTVSEAAEYLGHTVWGVRTLIWSRILPIVRYGRKQYLDVYDLEIFITSNKGIV